MSAKVCLSEMSINDLRLAAFGEGIPPNEDTEKHEGVHSITVDMASENIEMPFGMVNTPAFLELFWRETGADCDGEEEEMQLPDGITYKITLKE